MDIKKDIIYSTHLEREMKVDVYGHYGISVLFFPALNNSNDEFIDNGLISELEHLINIGKCKVFCISTVDREMWFGANSAPKEKSFMHFKFNQYVEEELVPYIYSQCGGPIPIITAGADKGAYHAANTFFRRPDIFLGTIALSGCYDLSQFTFNYFDDNCYFNSPVHYLPNLNDSYWLSYLFSRRHIYLASGTGHNEIPHFTQTLAEILNNKGFRYSLEIKGEDYNHDYQSWNSLFKFYIDKRL